MARIEINDLEREREVSGEEMRTVMGGALEGALYYSGSMEGNLWPKQWDTYSSGNNFIKFEGIEGDSLRSY